VAKDRNERYLKAFGQHLRSVRKSKSISQGKLSVIADIPLSQVGRIERGEVSTTLSTLFAIASALDIQPYTLLEFPFKKA